MEKKDDRSKEYLRDSLKNDITKMFEQILDYAQVAVPSPEVYKALRSKILRAGNDCIRDVNKHLTNYTITFVPTHEEIIEVKSQYRQR